MTTAGECLECVDVGCGRWYRLLEKPVAVEAAVKPGVEEVGRGRIAPVSAARVLAIVVAVGFTGEAVLVLLVVLVVVVVVVGVVAVVAVAAAAIGAGSGTAGR